MTGSCLNKKKTNCISNRLFRSLANALAFIPISFPSSETYYLAGALSSVFITP